jgi:hypothetical protein
MPHEPSAYDVLSSMRERLRELATAGVLLRVLPTWNPLEKALTGNTAELFSCPVEQRAHAGRTYDRAIRIAGPDTLGLRYIGSARSAAVNAATPQLIEPHEAAP